MINRLGFILKVMAGLLAPLFIAPVSADSLKVVTIQLQPFGFFENDKSRGILYDMADRIVKEAGYSCENRIVPYTRVIRELEIGRADFSILFPNETLEKCALKIAPVITLENVIIGPKGVTFSSLKDLHGKKVATVRGAEYDAAFSADQGIEKVETYYYEHNLKMLMAGHVDAMVGPKVGLYFTANRLGISKERLGEPLILNTKEAWLLFSKKRTHDKVISTLKAAVQSLVGKNVPQEIKAAYINP